MPGQKANCLLCGSPLQYADTAQMMTCALCGKSEMGHASCTQGHYVCNACHREQGVKHALEVCTTTESCNPIEIFQTIVADNSIYMHGPEHHTIVGAALLSAYDNALRREGRAGLDRNQLLQELKARSMQVPGGTCGYWGCCGAAISAGQFMSLVNGSTPLTGDAWGETTRLTSRILGRMADLGGPRCCKRTGFIAIEETVAYLEERYGVAMELPEQTVCTYFSQNKECLGKRCPYHP